MFTSPLAAAALDALAPETSEQVQALLASWILPERIAAHLPAIAFAETLPTSCANFLPEIVQLSLPQGYAVWIVPSPLMTSNHGQAMRKVLLQNNWLDILMPLYRHDGRRATAPFWIWLLRPERTHNLVAYVGARPEHPVPRWRALAAAKACAAFWELRPHPGFMPLPWDVALQEIRRFLPPGT